MLDVVAWNGTSMYDCDAEFRFFWAHTRLTQECDACEPPDPSVGREYAFAPTPWYECDADGVRRAYEARDVGDCEVDGLLFYHKEAAYDVGATPLVLLWRDAKTSSVWIPVLFITQQHGNLAVGVKARRNVLKRR